MSDRLNCVVHGQMRPGPALLLVHPLGADHRFWSECVSLWEAHFPCIACDLRSAGASPRAAAPVTIDHHVADLAGLVRELGMPSVVPIGCAIGAMVAASFAARHPDLAEALVLSNPTARTSLAAKAALSERAEMVQRLGMAAILPGAVDRAFMEQPRDGRYEWYFDTFSRQDAGAYAMSALGILDADITDDLRTIGCPTLVVAGGHDVLLPPEQAAAVHSLIPEAQFELVGDAAHFTPFQKPERFARLVLDFLRKPDESPLTSR